MVAAAGALATRPAGALAATPRVVAKPFGDRRRIEVGKTWLNFEREALVRPSGFAGGYMTEFWQTVVRMQSSSGAYGIGLGTQNVLWCDHDVLQRFAESGANGLMHAVTDRALQMVRGQSFEHPITLLAEIVDELFEYAKRITGMPGLNRTFVLNALVPFDNAAWVLYARENGIAHFDELVPERYRIGLSHRHEAIASLPSVTYGLPLGDVEQAAREGSFVIKLKLGHPGSQSEMLARDMERLSDVHRLVGGMTTPHTPDGRLRYDLDPNSRYERKESLLRLLEHARAIGAFDQIVVVEEPFPYENEEDVSDIPVPIAADESATTEGDAIRRFDLGYRGMALKAIAKTLSETIAMAQLCHERGIACMAADLTVNPVLVDWNKNIAARLAPFPGMQVGMMETNGHQQYRDWARMESYHPCAGAAWRRVRGGVFELGADFYERSGCILEPSPHYEELVTPAAEA